HGAIVHETHDLAEVAVHVLRGIELLPLARADPEVAVRAKSDAMPVVPAAVHLRYLPPDDLETDELAAVAVEREPRARHRGAAGAARARFGVADIDELVVGEVGVQHDVAEPALTAVADLGHAPYIGHRAVER